MGSGFTVGLVSLFFWVLGPYTLRPYEPKSVCLSVVNGHGSLLRTILGLLSYKAVHDVHASWLLGNLNIEYKPSEVSRGSSGEYCLGASFQGS